MIIVHYFLGFPPYRTGGLTKYAFDLMKAQSCDKNTVVALWPGKINFFGSKTKIKKCKNVSNIKSYEVINPQPVPLDQGILDIDKFIKKTDKQIYIDFLRKIKPDVIHIHTLMGLHKEFVDAAKELKIKTVFTSHDYFGICPKANLYRNGSVCDNDHDCCDCVNCNKTALSMKKITLMQSPLYRKLKNTAIVKSLRKKSRSNFFSENDDLAINVEDPKLKEKAEGYKKLRRYYLSILSEIDLIHFNSTLTEKIYKKYVEPKSSKVLNITHGDVKDNRLTNEWSYNGKLRITCLASVKPFKGFEVLRKALDQIWNSGNHNFELEVFGPVENKADYMEVHEQGYNYNELATILSQSDVVAAPSICYETFGFTVLEALSFGVPVIVSNHVGACDIVSKCGYVVKAGSVDDLIKAINSLNETELQKLRKNILKNTYIKPFDDFVKSNYKLYE